MASKKINQKGQNPKGIFGQLTLFGENQKGQAAVTDALFFLTIVAVVSVLMFTNAMSYGKSLIDTSVEYYENTYVISALKTLYAVSSPLEPDKYNVFDSSYNDSLFTMLKKDYYVHNAILSNEMKIKVMESLKEIMTPVNKNKNYLFYIYNPKNIKGFDEIIMAGFVMNQEENDEKITYICGTNSDPQIKNIAMGDISYYLSRHLLGQRFAEGRLSLLEKQGLDSTLVIVNTGLLVWTAVPDIDKYGDFLDPNLEFIKTSCCEYTPGTLKCEISP